MNLLLLYLEFFKVGIFAVGGGYAVLPFLFRMANDSFTFIQYTGWISTEQIGNFVAIAQCFPGAIGVNVVAQTGFLYSGIIGGVVAVLGLISPAIVVISLAAKAIQKLKNNKIAKAVFSGLRPAAAGLLSAAALGVWQLAMYKGGGAGQLWYEFIRWREGFICIVLFACLVKFKGHPVIYIVLGAVTGIVLGL